MDDKAFLAVRNILNQHDPAGVIFSSEVQDEYDPEAREIVQALGVKKTQDDLSEAIYAIFVQYFNPDIAGDKSKYEQIAREILEFLESQ